MCVCDCVSTMHMHPLMFVCVCVCGVSTMHMRPLMFVCLCVCVVWCMSTMYASSSICVCVVWCGVFVCLVWCVCGVVVCPLCTCVLSCLCVCLCVCVWCVYYASPWPEARQTSLSFTISWSLLKLMSTESVIPSSRLILCHPLLLPLVFPRIRVFSNEWALCVRLTKVLELQHQSFQ